MVVGAQRTLAVQAMLTELKVATKLIVKTESSAAYQAHEYANVVSQGLVEIRTH